MRVWLFPGSFDPVTLGHADLIRRAAAQCDELIAAVLVNDAKKGVFSLEERLDFLRKVTARWENVKVVSFTGLTVELYRRTGACAIVRGVRNGQDLVYEQQIEAANRGLDASVETIYLGTRPELSHVSSSMVRSVGTFGGNLAGLVPAEISDAVAERLRPRTE